MRKDTGFTIIELMITLSVAGVLLAVALPSYQNQIKNNCMTNSVNSLVTSLQLARSEATKRRQSVAVSAANAADATNEWGLGWTVWADDTSPAINLVPGAMDPGEELRIVALSCETTTMNETANNAQFNYRPTGFIDSAGTFDVCDNRTAETGRQLVISITGRPNVNSEFVCP